MHDIYDYLHIFKALLLAGLMGFLIRRLRQLPPSRMLKALIILTSLSALGLVLNAAMSFYGSFAPLGFNSERLSLAAVFRFIAGVLSLFAIEFCLITLTVLVCHPARGAAKKVLTPEERYQQT